MSKSKRSPYTIDSSAVKQHTKSKYTIGSHPLRYAIASKSDKKTLETYRKKINEAKQQIKEYTQGSPLAIYKNAPVTFAYKLGLEIVTEEQKQILLSVRDRKVTNVQASHGIGKCVAPDEPLILANGLELPAKNLVGHKFKLLTYVDGRITPVEAKAAWNLTEDIYEITTESGRRIVRSANHPLFAAIKWSRNGAKPLIDVREWQAIAVLQDWLEHPPEYPISKFMPDDWDTSKFKHSVVCAVPHIVDVFGDRAMPEHEIKIIAYLIGEGSLTGGTPAFVQEDNKQLSEALEILSKQMSGFCNIQSVAEELVNLELLEQKLKGAVYKQKILAVIQPGTRRNGNKPNPVTQLLEKYNLMGKNSYQKLIPSAIFQLPKYQLSLFLNRLFSTDGWACVSKPANG